METLNTELRLLFNQVDDWFTDILLDDPISRLNDIDDDENLDLLAKDLELLLEDEEHVEPEFYFYNSHNDDNIALLDDTIGYTCTLDRNGVKSASSLKLKKEFTTVVMQVSDDYRYKCNNEQNEDLKILTPTPQDHDYLSKPATRPLLLSNKQLIHSLRNKRKNTSVLNNEALKRFAPFSDKFKELSIKHVRLIAIENN